MNWGNSLLLVVYTFSSEVTASVFINFLWTHTQVWVVLAHGCVNLSGHFSARTSLPVLAFPALCPILGVAPSRPLSFIRSLWNPILSFFWFITLVWWSTMPWLRVHNKRLPEVWFESTAGLPVCTVVEKSVPFLALISFVNLFFPLLAAFSPWEFEILQ